MGRAVGYLPGLLRRRLADLPPGEAKTDAGVPPGSALVRAETARSLPQPLRALALADAALADAALAELRGLTGFDDDLRQQLTATSK